MSDIRIWTETYMKLADGLLQYKDNRKELIHIIEESFSEVDVPLPTLDIDQDNIRDIDPFTVFGLFNRGIKEDSINRTIDS